MTLLNPPHTHPSPNLPPFSHLPSPCSRFLALPSPKLPPQVPTTTQPTTSPAPLAGQLPLCPCALENAASAALPSFSSSTSPKTLHLIICTQDAGHIKLLLCSKLSLAPQTLRTTAILKMQPHKAPTLALQPIPEHPDSRPSISNPDMSILIIPKKTHSLANSGGQPKGHLLQAAF